MGAICYVQVMLATFITFLLDNHEPGTLLVVCSDRRTFVRCLLHSIQRMQREVVPPVSAHAGNDVADETMLDHDRTASPRHPPSPVTHPLLRRTLQVLAASQSIQVAFCSSIQVLRAYLAARHQVSAGSDHDTADKSVALVLLNPLSLHQAEASYSAQAISETIAAAVDAATRSSMKLTVVETIDRPQTPRASDEAGDVHMQEINHDSPSLGPGQEQIRQGTRQVPTRAPECDLLQDQVPVLSSTTKLFGISDELAVLSRTVAVQAIVERWCTIMPLPEI